MSIRINVPYSGGDKDDDGGVSPSIPEGWYQVVVTEVVNKPSRLRSNRKYLEWTFQVERPSHIHDDYRLYYASSLDMEFIEPLQKLLEALTGIKVLGLAEINLEAFVGMKILARVKSEVYNGKTRTSIAEFKSVRGSKENART